MGKIFSIKDSAVIREQVLEQVKGIFGDTLLVEAGAIAVPVVGPDGEQGFAKIAVSVPKGERGGDGWDPEADADEFARHQAEQAEKRAVAAKRKAAKIAKDEAARKAKAEAKA